MVKKKAEINKTRTELMKVQAYVMEYLMKEEELVWEVAIAKDGVERMQSEHKK